MAAHYGSGRVNAARAVAAALPAISVADVSLPEVVPGATATATLTFHLTAPAVRDVTVHYATADDSAIAGTHYTAASGDVTFPSGSDTQTVALTINGSILTQPDLVFFVNLSAPTDATLARTRAIVVITARDSDGDGMADYWEIAHGFNPNDPSDGPLDRDGDGQSNAAEFFAGTNPDNPNDRLRITAIAKIANGFRLRFPSVLGRTYQVEESATLVSPTWSPLLEIPGTGSELQVDAVAPGGRQHFYRVRVIR